MINHRQVLLSEYYPALLLKVPRTFMFIFYHNPKRIKKNQTQNDRLIVKRKKTDARLRVAYV